MGSRIDNVTVTCADNKTYTLDFNVVHIGLREDHLSTFEKLYGNDLKMELVEPYSDNSKLNITIPDRPNMTYAVSRDKKELFFDFAGTSDKKVVKYLMEKDFGPLLFCYYFKHSNTSSFIPNTVEVLREFIHREPTIINRALIMNGFIDGEKIDLYDLDFDIIDGILENTANVDLDNFRWYVENIEKDRLQICMDNNISVPNFLWRVKFIELSTEKAIQLGKQELHEYGLNYFRSGYDGYKSVINKLVYEQINKKLNN